MLLHCYCEPEGHGNHFVIASETKQSHFLARLLRHCVPRNDTVGLRSLFRAKRGILFVAQ